MSITLFEGDNLSALKTLAAQSVDSVVTDPPYGISFMKNKWDHDVPTVDFWNEISRVLKPGGHVLSFSGTRTYHRMVANIEVAGFEICDQIGWVYGSGMPKSLDVSRAIDKDAGAERKVVGVSKHFSAKRQKDNFSAGGEGRAMQRNRTITAPATPDAERWNGWGTALKPAWEPCVVARKPSPATPTPALFSGQNRFFYCGKASKKDRAGSRHPTIKPIALMSFLVRLVTPQGGVVLDPFAGSGTTGQAALDEGCKAVLMERDHEFADDIRSRLALFIENDTVLF